MTDGTPIKQREMFIAIFLIGFTCLMYELIQVRMLSFFLGGISNFLAIPLALFGLALGSMYCHFFYKGTPEKLITRFSAAVFPVLTAVFIVFFAVANLAFSDIHVALADPYRDSLRLLVYSVTFLPPYFLFGALLSSYFSIGANQIGRLYFYDLLGAGLGCLVTPIMFTYTDLSPVILTLLFAAFLLVLNTTMNHKIVAVLTMAIIFGVVQLLAANGTLFKEHPNPGRLARTLLRPKSSDDVQEVAVRWNSLARTSLVRAMMKDPTGQANKFTIVQDDGVSNVHVYRYDPSATAEDVMPTSLHHSFPFLIGHDPKNVLVMFAGVARDMVLIDRLASGKAKITGVELNDAVTDLVNEPVMHNMNLHNFVKREGIALVAAEGRDFLNTTSEKYDVIYLGTNGSIHANRTGHSRKYLDTYEAMTEYLDHLSPDGMMVFANQPVQTKIPAFRKLFEERGMPNFDKAIHVMGRPHIPEMDTMVLRPQGLTRDNIAAIEGKARDLDKGMKLLYSPHSDQGVERIKHVVTASLDEIDQVTDDSPFIRKVELTGFTLLPNKKQLEDKVYASNWIKIFTIILFFVVSTGVILAARFKGGVGSRVPLPWLLYFLVSGISYMCVEIGLIAKTELFLGNPLYAVAVILAFFLAYNGIGALLQEKYRIMRGPWTLAIITVVSIGWSVTLVHMYNQWFLSVPLAVKVLLVAVAVFPSGTALGMFYPFGVSNLVGAGKQSTVPMTYCIATLSSVLGSSFAMTAITNTGFSTMIILGSVGYSIVALVYLVARRMTPKPA